MNSPHRQSSTLPLPINTSTLPIEDIVDLLKRHCVLTSEEIDAIALWITASYLINSFRVFPKLSLISPEKRCGKTTTMEVIQSVAKDGVLLSSISPASIYRITQQFQPTLLIDEADTFVKDGSPELVGIFNSSHTKAGSNVYRCVGDNHQVASFNTWMPMVFASIGSLPDTLMDRSIVINLRRKKSHESVVRVPVNFEDLQKSMRASVLTWCKSNEPVISISTMTVPTVGNDRAEDNWFALFVIAEALGNDWLQRCEIAFRALTVPVELELPTLLLMAIKEYFDHCENTRASSANLVDELCKDATGPWLECNNGRRVSQYQIARLLRNYGITPSTMRFGESVSRGYDRADFIDAFERYIP